MVFCVFLPPLLNIFCFCYIHTILSFIAPIFAWNVPLVSLIFMKRSPVFPILFFSSISLQWSLRKAIVSLLAIHWNSAFRWVYPSFFPWHFPCLLFSAICMASLDNHFSFLHFFFWWMVLIMASCTMLQISIHSSSDTCLSDLLLDSICHFHCIIIRDLI